MKIFTRVKNLFATKSKIAKEAVVTKTVSTEIENNSISENEIKDKWLTIGCSVIGNSHIANNIPCQDSHYIGFLSAKWDIAVVSDGAGSHKNSHHGSSFMVNNVVEVLRDLSKDEPWFLNGTFPTPREWRDAAITAFSFVYDNLMNHGVKLGYENPARTMGGTINLLIYSDNGYCSAHIGDGRAAVQYEDGSWDSTMTPFKGEQAGETVFLTSMYAWENPSLCIETRVIKKQIKSFALISDGLEHYSFYCNVKAEKEEKYSDPNKPFEQFFNKNLESIKGLHNNGMNVSEIEEKFSTYLKTGHPQIALESDDKTIILGTKI